MSGSTNVKRLLLTAIAVVLMPVYLFAGNTGKITGIVKDKETGDALPGVNVVLEGTTMGAATSAKGEYSIQGVPAGVYTVTTNMISYAKVSKSNVRVIPDFTTKLDFELVPTSVSGEEQIIVAERPLIQRDQTMTMTVTTSEEIKNLPLRGFQAVANLGVGIVVNTGRNVEGGTSNINIRGGRPNETGVYIDGFQQNNLLTGVSNAVIPSGAVEEVQVITGGFDAEYGRNQSGIIQVTTKGGGQKYSGYAEYVSDKMMNVISKNEYFNYNVYSGGVGGQLIPGNNKIKFYVSAEGRLNQDAEPSIIGNPDITLSNIGHAATTNGLTLDTAIFNVDPATGKVNYNKGPRGTNASGNGVNSDKGVNGQMKLTFDVIENKLRFDLSGNYGHSIRRVYTQFDVLRPDFLERRTISNANLGFVATYTINSTSFFDFGLNYFYNDRKRVNDALGTNLPSYLAARNGNTGGITYFGEGYLADINSGIQLDQENQDKYGAVKANYTNQFDKHNQLKVGFDYFQHVTRLLNVDTQSPLVGLTNNVGFVVRPDAYGNNTVYMVGKDDYNNYIAGPGKPYSLAVFGQEKLEYEGLVLRGGVRFDAFNPGSKRLKSLANPTGADQLLLADDFTSAKTDKKISPRLSVSFPISEKTQFRLSYGKFFQQPNLNNLYIGPYFLQRMSVNGGIAPRGGVGNPNLEPEKSTQYEVGFRRTLSEKSVIDISAFYKDVSNLVQLVLTPSNPQGLYLLKNDDQGVIQGVTFSYELRQTGKVSARLSYTLSSARGTGSGETTGFNAAWLGFDQTKFNAPLTFDQRHLINASIDVRNAKGEGPAVGGVKPLENTGINFVVNAGSGQPYTPREVSNIIATFGGRPTARRLSANKPWTLNIDTKADKVFHLTNNITLDIYLQVLNLLNRKNVLFVYDATGQANNDGYLDTSAGQSLTANNRNQYYTLLNDGFAWAPARQWRLGALFNF